MTGGSEIREPTPSERKLASIAVEMAITAAQRLQGRSTEEVAEWAKRQLAIMGYANDSVGQEWAYLTSVSTERDSV